MKQVKESPYFNEVVRLLEQRYKSYNIIKIDISSKSLRLLVCHKDQAVNVDLGSIDDSILKSLYNAINGKPRQQEDYEDDSDTYILSGRNGFVKPSPKIMGQIGSYSHLFEKMRPEELTDKIIFIIDEIFVTFASISKQLNS